MLHRITADAIAHAVMFLDLFPLPLLLSRSSPPRHSAQHSALPIRHGTPWLSVYHLMLLSSLITRPQSPCPIHPTPVLYDTAQGKAFFKRSSPGAGSFM